jgi:hypothetical protein
MLITVVFLLMPLGIDVKVVFLQVVSLKLHVHLPGHAVTVATCKMDRMVMTQGPRAFMTIVPVKYENKFEKLRHGRSPSFFVASSTMSEETLSFG